MNCHECRHKESLPYSAHIKCACLKRGFWPGYDDHDEAIQSWSLVAPEPWMAERAQFAPKFEIPADEEAPDPTKADDFDGRH